MILGRFKIISFSTISLIVMVLLVFAFLPKSSSAQLEVQGLSIDPFLIELNMTPGQTSLQTITLTNTTSQPLTFTASINDFVPNGNTGQPLFLNSNEQSDTKHSLSRWITVIQQPQFTIQSGAKTEVGISITVPSDAEPGTHYGGVLFGQPVQQVIGSAAAVQHKAGAIILVKLGKSQEQVQVSKFFTQQQIYQRGPVEFLLTAHNFGNVHSKIKGDIKIKNIWGLQVAEVPVNPDALIVLPESARDFSSVWRNNLGFGRYTAEAVLFYGSPKLELRVQTSFWIIPMKEIVLGVLGTLILGIIGYIGIRRYNRYIIKNFRNEN